ncbi:MAG TPA: hypothetical protein VG245_02155 [Candidatus Dormibacteraeota bacterium]|jgi:hypothetical protein|nr:hypothetical protein [Candidatus Dormibacteraeota bacterium]
MKLRIARETVRELSVEEIAGMTRIAGGGTQQSICIGCPTTNPSGGPGLSVCICDSNHGLCRTATGTLFSCLG